MRHPLIALAAPLLLLGLAACGPQEPPEEETEVTTEEETGTPTTEEETEATPSETPVEVSDGGGDGLGDDDDEVVQPTETTEYVEQGEGTEDE